jgi:energy-coupling factor transporter transmembrane protein EcfT
MMHVIGEGASQEIHSAKTAIVLIAFVIVAFWRVLLRLLLALVAIAVVVLVGAGAIVLLQR